MADTVKFVIDGFNPSKVKTIINRLSHVKRSIDEFNNEALYAYHRNFRFKIQNGFLMGMGSIPKLVYGTNQFNFPIICVRESISYLSDLFNTDLTSAKLIRVDYGANLGVEEPVNNYLRLLSRKSRFNKALNQDRNTNNETVDFRTKAHTQIYYDKIAELKAHKEKILVQNHLLRIESKFLNRLPSTFKVPIVTFDMLDKNWFVQKAVKIWLEDYLSIEKTCQPLLELKTSSGKHFYSVLAMHGVLRIGGIDTVIQQINNIPNIDAIGKYRLKQKLKKLDFQAANDTSLKLIHELDEKVKTFASNVAALYI